MSKKEGSKQKKKHANEIPEKDASNNPTKRKTPDDQDFPFKKAHVDKLGGFENVIRIEHCVS